MRGSVYYQTGQLCKAIYIEGLSKENRVDSSHEYYQCVASYKTMETYRNVWNNFGNYLREHWKLKDFTQISNEHVQAYFEYKIEYYPSVQYAEKISSALGKLAIALEKYVLENYEKNKTYDFKIRKDILKHAKKNNLIADRYHNRVYKDPEKIIGLFSNEDFKIAAKIQLEGGARVEGVSLIKKEQLKGTRFDQVASELIGVVLTKEKGGKEGEVLINLDTYRWLEMYFMEKSIFKIDYQKYANAIRNICKIIGAKPEGSHGFRWTFAERRVRTYQARGYSYLEALHGVSLEMKHHRASITEHYLGG